MRKLSSTPKAKAARAEAKKKSQAKLRKLLRASAEKRTKAGGGYDPDKDP